MGHWVIFDGKGNPAWFGSPRQDGAEWVEGVDAAFLISHRRLPSGKWVPREPEKPVPPSPEEIAAAKAEEERQRRKAEDEARKWEGVEFEGVMCSATKDDQNGLVSVWVDYQTSPADFDPTEFQFANGSRLLIHKGNVREFAALWRPFRRQFFNPEGGKP